MIGAFNSLLSVVVGEIIGRYNGAVLPTTFLLESHRANDNNTRRPPNINNKALYVTRTAPNFYYATIFKKCD